MTNNETKKFAAFQVKDIAAQKIAVLLGGKSGEREVSLMSGNGVIAALKSVGITAEAFDPAAQDVGQLKAHNIEIAMIHLHGRFGEDGCVQGALELLRIPYTGSGVMASAIGIDKGMTKRVWQTHGLSTPRYVIASSLAEAQDQTKHMNLPLPWAVKPVREGSSLGFTRVDRAEDLPAAFALAATKDVGENMSGGVGSEVAVMIEQFIAGPEYTIAIVQDATGVHHALPIIEIKAPQGNYDFQNKYYTDVVQYECPAKMPADLAQTIEKLALDAFHALGCSGWGRVDVMLDAATQIPYLLEVNTSPGMTSHSLVPMAAAAIGLDYAALCVHLAGLASLKQG